MVNGGISRTSKASLDTPIIVSFLVSFSLFNFTITAFSTTNGVMDRSSILSVFAPCASSGLSAWSMSVGAAIATAITGVASARPILRLSTNGSVFLRVPMGRAAFRSEPGIAVMARAGMRLMASC